MSDNNNRLNPTVSSDNVFLRNSDNASTRSPKVSLVNSSNNISSENSMESTSFISSSQPFVPAPFNNTSHVSLSSVNNSEHLQAPVRLHASSSYPNSTRLFNHPSTNNESIKLKSAGSNNSGSTLNNTLYSNNGERHQNPANQQFQNNSVQGQFLPSQQVPPSNNNAPLSTGKSIKETMKKPYSELETMEEKDLKRVEYSNTRMYYLTKRVKEKVGMFPSTEIRAILQALALVAREDIIQNGFFIIPNIAVLKVLEKPARDSYNPYYKKIMHIDKHYILRAYPYPSLKRMIKKINNGEFYEEDEYIIHRDEKTGEYYIDIRGVLEDY